VPSHVVVQREEIFGQRADHRARGVAARVRAPEPPHDARSSTHRALCPPTETFARSRNCAVCPPRSSDQRPSAREKADKLARSILSRSTSRGGASRVRRARKSAICVFRVANCH
jgi:hypothetical protein